MVKSILFRGTMKGKGIVNYDSTGQRFMRDRFKDEYQAGYLGNDNVKIAKHTFYKHEDDNGGSVWERRITISPDCMRHSIFEEDFPFQNTRIMHYPDLFVKILASMPALMRGYMFVLPSNLVLKKKSPLMITGAEQISEAVSHFEINTMSGAKKTKSDADDSSDTSMHYEEKIGAIEYAFEGAIDIKELQFVSMSQAYDRLAVDRDMCGKLGYRELLSGALGSEVEDVHYYVMKNSVLRTVEEGILLTQAQTLKLIKELVKRILSLRIQRAKGYAQISGLEMKAIIDPLPDFLDDESGWKRIAYPEDLKLNPEHIEVFYEQVSQEEAEAAEAKAIELQKKMAEQRQKENKSRKAKKGTKKEEEEEANNAEKSADSEV